MLAPRSGLLACLLLLWSGRALLLPCLLHARSRPVLASCAQSGTGRQTIPLPGQEGDPTPAEGAD